MLSPALPKNCLRVAACIGFMASFSEMKYLAVRSEKGATLFSGNELVQIYHDPRNGFPSKIFGRAFL